MTRLPRPAAAAVLALVVVPTAACSVTNPQATHIAYIPTDAAIAYLNPDVTIASIMIATADPEGPGNFVARLVNDGVEPVTIEISGGGEADLDLSVRVPPRSTVGIGPEGDEQVLLETVGEIPGKLIPFVFSVEGGDPVEVDVPVLDATLEEYAQLVPNPQITNPV